MTGPGRRSIASRAAATGPSRIGSGSPGVVADERAQPERQAVDQDRLVGLRARERRREVVPDLDRRPVGRTLAAMPGDPVVELRVARRGRREEPDAAAVREPRRGGEPEPALAAPGAAEDEDQRPATQPVAGRADDRGEGRGHDDGRDDSSTEAPSPSPSSRPRAATISREAASPSAAPTTAPTATAGPSAASPATRPGPRRRRRRARPRPPR